MLGADRGRRQLVGLGVLCTAVVCAAEASGGPGPCRSPQAVGATRRLRPRRKACARPRRGHPTLRGEGISYLAAPCGAARLFGDRRANDPWCWRRARESAPLARRSRQANSSGGGWLPASLAAKTSAGYGVWTTHGPRCTDGFLLPKRWRPRSGVNKTTGVGSPSRATNSSKEGTYTRACSSIAYRPYPPPHR